MAEMTAVEFEGRDGGVHRAVVRRPSSMAEFQILQLAQALALPAPAPYLLHEIGDEAALVMAFVAGQIDFSPVQVDDYVRQMAAELVRVHGADLSLVDRWDGGSSYLPINPEFCQDFRKPPPKFEGAGFDVGEVLAVMAERPFVPRNAPRLLHGDFWAGNMLWWEGELVAVIDWEDAALGSPLKDLAEARVELVWLFGLAAVNTFTDYYRARMDLDYSHLPYWDLCAVLRLWRLTKGRWGWLVDFVGDYGRADISEETIRDGYGAFVGRALSRL